MFCLDNPSLEEALEILTEECAEVIMTIQKIQRHGMDSTNPLYADSTTNKVSLEKELGHVLSALDRLVRNGHLNLQEISMHQYAKNRDVVKWLHYNSD